MSKKGNKNNKKISTPLLSAFQPSCDNQGGFDYVASVYESLVKKLKISTTMKNSKPPYKPARLVVPKNDSQKEV